jgi:hypothetical protein
MFPLTGLSLFILAASSQHAHRRATRLLPCFHSTVHMCHTHTHTGAAQHSSTGIAALSVASQPVWRTVAKSRMVVTITGTTDVTSRSSGVLGGGYGWHLCLKEQPTRPWFPPWWWCGFSSSFSFSSGEPLPCALSTLPFALLLRFLWGLQNIFQGPPAGVKSYKMTCHCSLAFWW